jgi:hypothetical protein
MAKLIGTGTNQVPTNGMLGGMAFQSPEDVTVKKIQEEGYNVVTQTDIGTAPNQIPLNQFLGGLAYMDSVAGLDFSATSSASTGTVTSQILDDYEEGTWTATLTDGTTTFNGDARYTKIGNLVFISLRLNNAGSGFTGSVYITGLPFTAITPTNYALATNINYTITATTWIARISATTSQIRFLRVGTATQDNVELTGNDINQFTDFDIAGFYRV